MQDVKKQKTQQCKLLKASKPIKKFIRHSDIFHKHFQLRDERNVVFETSTSFIFLLNKNTKPNVTEEVVLWVSCTLGKMELSNASEEKTIPKIPPNWIAFIVIGRVKLRSPIKKTWSKGD